MKQSTPIAYPQSTCLLQTSYQNHKHIIHQSPTFQCLVWLLPHAADRSAPFHILSSRCYGDFSWNRTQTSSMRIAYECVLPKVELTIGYEVANSFITKPPNLFPHNFPCNLCSPVFPSVSFLVESLCVCMYECTFVDRYVRCEMRVCRFSFQLFNCVKCSVYGKVWKRVFISKICMKLSQRFAPNMQANKKIRKKNPTWSWTVNFCIH